VTDAVGLELLDDDAVEERFQLVAHAAPTIAAPAGVT
jgi:hypothetical protein